MITIYDKLKPKKSVRCWQKKKVDERNSTVEKGKFAATSNYVNCLRKAIQNIALFFRRVEIK